MAAQAPPEIAKDINPATFERRYDECQSNLAWLAEVIRNAKPDLLVMFGDDQRHIIEHLCAGGIDVGQSSRIAEGRSVSHPFAFVHRRILDGNKIPTIPIWINTYYPPNQPSPQRCYEVGRAIRAAIEDWDEDIRVGIVASGGLSHFVIDEELDHTMLKAMKERDAETIFALPRPRMQSGTSESTLWLAAAGAVEHLDMTETRYVPCYRTAAGTGCAMGFAHWH